MLYSAEFSTFMHYCVRSAALGFLIGGVGFDFLNHWQFLASYCFVHYRVGRISHRSWDI